MSAKLIEGVPLAAQIRAEIAREVRSLLDHGKKVRLACVQVGEKPESMMYVKNQQKLCATMGIEFQMVQLPDEISQSGIIQKIHELNQTPEVTGIILELPLPARINTFLCQRAI